MRKSLRLTLEWLSLVAVLLVAPLTASAVAAVPALGVPSGLSIAEIKITGDEFMVLQNNNQSVIADLSAYWIYDFNNTNPFTAGVSSSQQQLPNVRLDAGQTLLLSAVTRPTCGAAVAGKLNLSLTDSGGFIEIVQLGQNSGGAVTQTPGDVVSWSSGAAGVIQSVPSSTKDPAGMYYRYAKDGGYSWQLADVDATQSCQLNVITAGTTTPANTAGLQQASGQPPATIVGVEVTDTGVVGPTLPAADIGLEAPQITELLPNPLGTDNDDTDEFIEIYNPNAAEFDMTGFVLQTGKTVKHNFTIPSGTKLPGKSFTAFYASDTGLSLSNSGGQAALIDPLGTTISQTDVYGTAKDGQAWALANKAWAWSLQTTPGSANVIKIPAATTKKTSTSTSKTTAKKTTAKTTASKTSATTKTAAKTNSSATTAPTSITPIHGWVLAVVAGLAVVYGVYEYRLDLANRFYEFRKHRAARPKTRYALPGR